MTSNRLRTGVLGFVIAAAAIVSHGTQTVATPDLIGTSHVTIASAVFDITPDGRFATAGRAADAAWFVVDLDSGAETSIGRPAQISDDGTAVWYVDGSDLIRETVGGGIAAISNPLADVPGDWVAVEVVDTQGDDVIIFGSDGAAGDTARFAYDPVAEAAVRLDSGDTSSPNGAWTVFVSFDPDVIPGLDGSEARLFLRHEASGLVTQVPATGDSNSWQAQVVDTGRVFFRSPATTLQGPGSTDTFDGLQLFAWDGVGAPTQLTVGPSGTPPTGPLTDGAVGSSFQATPSGTTVAVTTFAENLDGERGGFDARLYRLDVDPRPAVNDDAMLETDEEYCVGVYGADPGDFAVVNITPLFAGTGGFGTAHSSDVAAGGTSSVNFGPGTVDPNVAFVEVGDDGRICFTNSRHGPVHVIIDQLVVGASAALEAATVDGSDRVIDTRDGDPVPPSTARCFAVNGDAGAVTAVNVTPVLATAPGFGVIHSSDESAGTTSNVNFQPGSFDPNLAFAVIGADGRICFTNSQHGPVHVIVDQLMVGAGSEFSSPTPDGATRLIDTRDDLPDVLARGQRLCVTPSNADAGDWVALNVTPVLATGPGFGTVHSSDDPPGGTSNVNFGPGSVDPNVAIAEVGTDGQVCFTNSANSETHVIIDQLINANPETFRRPAATGAKRLTDTRLGRS